MIAADALEDVDKEGDGDVETSSTTNADPDTDAKSVMVGELVTVADDINSVLDATGRPERRAEGEADIVIDADMTLTVPDALIKLAFMDRVDVGNIVSAGMRGPDGEGVISCASSVLPEGVTLGVNDIPPARRSIPDAVAVVVADAVRLAEPDREVGVIEVT
jgi:hypothetical protein